MKLNALAFRWHRWLGWLVGAQVMFWVIGGSVFALLPFQAWVKAGDAIEAPPLVLPPGWLAQTEQPLRALASAATVTSIATVATPHGTALKLRVQGQPQPVLLRTDGQTWRAPDADAILTFARRFLRADARVSAVERLPSVPLRLGIVAETGGRGDLWRVSVDDRLGTRLYFLGDTGEFLAARNEAWVWYDFFWRLHIMDYTGGEDFNGTLLRVSALCALGLAGAGTWLSLLALRRAWRQRRRRRLSSSGQPAR